ncbi:MAG TPA: circadian clock protein KaiC [Methanotrichaceae archaeon]|nr:circadian clock protein KaiC [Methanotrichaceae archaeon]
MSPKEEFKGIEKIHTGIPGFDDITYGGLPKGRTTLILGGAGSGKTVFALQTLVNGARDFGEPGIFVAFEENSRQIIANASTFGWDLEALENEKLFFVDARMSPDLVMSGGFDLTGMLASIKAKADEIGATRIAFDSIDVLLTLLNDPAAERQELYRIHDWFSETGLTGIMTFRTGSDENSSERYGFMQFMADCVVVLYHRLMDRISLREIRVVKYRGSSFSENEFPMVIGHHGIEIANIGLSEPEYEVFTDRVSTGVERLDSMLAGGYIRGSSILITGAPGTAKSSLAGAFIEAACKRGERSLYVSFDESAKEIVRNMASINIQLEPHVESGTLRMYSARTEARSAEEHLMSIRRLIEEHRPRCIVIDPLSAMVKAGGHITALGAAERLIHLAKGKGITLLCTSLLEIRGNLTSEATEIRISTIADTWINLSYVPQGGERNRALTIVKARGTRHSNQVRELILSNEGITLADVYTAGGEVLMGTLRFEREEADRQAEGHERLEAQSKKIELELGEAEINAKMQALKKQLEANRAEMARLSKEEETRRTGGERKLADLQRLRRADLGEGMR